MQTQYGDGHDPKQLRPFYLPSASDEHRRVRLVPHADIPIAIEVHRAYPLLYLPASSQHKVFGFDVHSKAQKQSALSADADAGCAAHHIDRQATTLIAFAHSHNR